MYPVTVTEGDVAMIVRVPPRLPAAIVSHVVVVVGENENDKEALPHPASLAMPNVLSFNDVPALMLPLQLLPAPSVTLAKYVHPGVVVIDCPYHESPPAV